MAQPYEVIRSAMFDVLSGKVKQDNGLGFQANRYEELKIGVGKVLVAKGLQKSPQPWMTYQADVAIELENEAVFREVFWDLFRQGIITLGSDGANPEYPHFSLTGLGKRTLEGQTVYFVHDVAAYRTQLESQVPGIDPTTMIYLQEALHAFRAGCILSTSVMLGVAAEHTFELVIEAASLNPAYKALGVSCQKESKMLSKMERFRQWLENNKGSLPWTVREAVETNVLGIMEVIRSFRNDSGHPSGNILDREQAHALLLLFPHYCRKMYDLRAHFQKPSP